MDNISKLAAELRTLAPTLELRENEPMHRHTTFKIGGPVPLMALPKTEEEASSAIAAAASVGIEPFFLGRGSNLLVSDAGVNRFVIKSVGSPEHLRLEGENVLWADSGMLLSQVAVFAMEQGLTGMEFAHGIPGSLGGAVFMNAGAYDGEMSQIVMEVDCLNKAGERETLSLEQLDFTYRHSVFADGSRLILGAKLHLHPGEKESIQDQMLKLMERRRSKQPLEFPSAGSTFKRPPGRFAGGLIQECGLKGTQIGGAKVSEKHAGFIVNTGDATCSDVLALIRKVREVVFQETGVLLEPEVRMIGCAL